VFQSLVLMSYFEGLDLKTSHRNQCLAVRCLTSQIWFESTGDGMQLFLELYVVVQYPQVKALTIPSGAPTRLSCCENSIYLSSNWI